MGYFSGKVAIVTGGASGIGLGLCEELALGGAQVTVADINLEAADRTAARITAEGTPARAAHVDVAQEDQVRGLVELTARESGRLDYMFNNAGVGLTGEMKHLAREHWQRMLDVNLWGVIHGTAAAYAVMREQGHGHIVNTASLAGLIPGPTQTAYCTPKHAVVGFSMSLREEAAGLGVKVTVVCPGFIGTSIWDSMTVLPGDLDDRRAVTSSGLTRALPFQMLDGRQAARVILRGVQRNRAIVVFPLHARLLWWLYRLYPPLVAPLGRRLLTALQRPPDH